MIRVDETDPVGEVEPSFPYRDVTVRRGVNFKDHYDIQSEIGRGKFGTVYHCKEKTSGLLLAAKVVTTTRKEDRRSVEREVEIMRRLQHPRLIQLYDSIDTGKEIYVILELIQGGELFERVIDDDFVLTERSCAVFMRQICEGIEFVHTQHILHLDMKPENILCLTKEGNRIKIIDFGLARHYDPRKKMQVLFGTPEFVAPEVVNFDQIGFGTDMWSIGVICYVLLSGLSPFMGDTDVETMANVTIAKYDFDHDAFADISEDAKDFIRCLLVKDKEKRATATMCRQHRWLAIKTPSPRKSTNDAKIMIQKTSKHLDTGARSKKLEVGSSQLAGSSSRQELDVTKDNLRNFVERWREHPDSPYLMENDSSIGASEDIKVDNNNLELISMRGQSPSPCGSVCTTSSESSDTNADKTNCMLAVPNSMVLGLERRASEGYSAHTSHRRDQAAQIVLAEEIIKLSEHLRNLASGQITSNDPETGISMNKVAASEKNEKSKDKVLKKSKGGKTNGVSLGKKSANEKISSGESLSCSNGHESNEISEKLSSIKKQRKINGTTFNGNRSYVDKTDNSITNIKLKNTFNKIRSSDDKRYGESSYVDMEANEEKGPSNNRSRVTWKMEKEEDAEKKIDRLSREALNDENTSKSREIDLTPPWRRTRAKNRFNETCRDVPRISKLRDIHKSLNLDEPQCTKDLLLHLLGEWDDASRPGGIGRKSVSVDWGGEESVARRSMNSLAEYFQLEQQKSTSSSVTNTATSSINR